MPHYELLNSLPDPVQEEEMEEGADEWDVEVIVKARLVPNSERDTSTIPGTKTNIPGRWEYFVKWAGYPDSENTWEPPEHFTKSKRLIKEFWDDSFEFGELTPLDIDGEDDDIATVHAAPDWIEFQTNYFYNNCEQTTREVDDDPMITTIDNTPLVEEQYDPHAEPGSDTEDEDEDEAENGRDNDMSDSDDEEEVENRRDDDDEAEAENGRDDEEEDENIRMDVEDEDVQLDDWWNRRLLPKPVTPEPPVEPEHFVNPYPSPTVSMDDLPNFAADSTYDIELSY